MTRRLPQDTSLGGNVDRFPETQGDVRSVLGKPGPLAQRTHGELLCARYWRPVYAYIRIAWRKGNEESKDLTQAFFLWLLEGDALEKYDPARGGFRPFLKVLLKSFVGHEERALGRLKRGGHLNLVALDGESPALRDAAEAATADPNQAFERVWLEQLLQDAVEAVRKRSLASGKDLRFRVYEEFTQPSKGDRPSYKELAARHRLKETDVENYLFQTREEIRTELRAALRESCENTEEFEDEWKRLFGC